MQCSSSNYLTAFHLARPTLKYCSQQFNTLKVIVNHCTVSLKFETHYFTGHLMLWGFLYPPGTHVYRKSVMGDKK